jgi:hypothetical protein
MAALLRKRGSSRWAAAIRRTASDYPMLVLLILTAVAIVFIVHITRKLQAEAGEPIHPRSIHAAMPPSDSGGLH